MQRFIARVWVLPLIAAGMTGVWFSASAALGELYLMVAEHSYITQPAAERTQVAAQMAAGLMPWNVSARSMLGKALRAQGQPLTSRRQFHQALLQAPGSPVRWQDVYETALAVADTEGMLAALQQVHALAPHSNALQLRNALLGQQYWDRGTPKLHEMWVAAARNSLIYRRNQLLFFAYQMQLETPLCTHVPPIAKVDQDRRYSAWCQLAPEARNFCVPSMPMTEKQKRWCVAMGAEL